jgi:DNA (cytosine-5)-methyltransferase 1
MNVLSLFDGMSCGQQALNRAGIHYDNYYASEIDKHAIIVTQANYPNTIQLGDVRNINIDELPTIDLLIGGSPCQSFSFAGKRKGMSTKDEKEILTLEHYLQLKEEQYEFEGQSYLFWEFMRVLNTIKPKYFLLENVMMGEKWEKVLSKAIGVRPIEINSSLVSAQNRRRLYWTNIGLEPAGLFGDLESSIKQPKDKGLLLKDILEQDVDEKYYLSEKMISWLLKHSDKTGNELKLKNEDDIAGSLTVSGLKSVNLSADFIVHSTFGRTSKNGNGGNGHLFKTDNKSYALDTQNCQAIEILHQSKIRRLTPVECERLQTVEDNYTNHVSNSQRYKMLGNGWTIDVIAHIFNYIK